MVLFGVVFLCLLSLTTAEMQCSGVLPPGLDKLRKGVDITTVDMLPLDIKQPQGFKGLIVDYTCESTRRWRNPYNGETYQLPDEVEMTSLPGGAITNHTDIYTSTTSLAKTRAQSMGVDFLFGIFSASASMKKMTHTINNHSRFIADVSAFHSAYRVDMAPYFFLKIGRHAKYFIERLLPKSYSSNPRLYAEFIQYFGTHYFTQGKFGGMIRDYMEIKTELLKSMSEQDIKKSAVIDFANILKINGGLDGRTQSTTTTFKSSTNSFVKYYGGKVSFLDDRKQLWKEWEKSVYGNPWMFSGELAPISNLISNENVKKAMETAVREHIDRAYLNEAQAHCHTLLSQTSDATVRARIHAELRNIASLKNLRLGALKKDNSKLARIRSELEIPNWFVHNTKLCYYWRPDGRSRSQCGVGVSRNLCAKVNSYTTWYRDDTDYRSGGCRMKWGIVSDGYKQTDSWFNNVQVCFRWYADGDRGQCGGGAPRQMCASVGSFTREYRDDSDRRGGGCQMSWKLQLPSNAPMWMRTARLCYEWYPDGDKGQCGRGVGRKLCAATDQWTTYYRDDTDWRGGGCRMRWGILI